MMEGPGAGGLKGTLGNGGLKVGTKFAGGAEGCLENDGMEDCILDVPSSGFRLPCSAGETL